MIRNDEERDEVMENLPKFKVKQCTYYTNRSERAALDRTYRCTREWDHEGFCVEYDGERPVAKWLGLDEGRGHGADERVRAEKGNRREDFQHLQHSNWRGPGMSGLVRD